MELVVLVAGTCLVVERAESLARHVGGVIHKVVAQELEQVQSLGLFGDWILVERYLLPGV